KAAAVRTIAVGREIAVRAAGLDGCAPGQRARFPPVRPGCGQAFSIEVDKRIKVGLRVVPARLGRVVNRGEAGPDHARDPGAVDTLPLQCFRVESVRRRECDRVIASSNVVVQQIEQGPPLPVAVQSTMSRISGELAPVSSPSIPNDPISMVTMSSPGPAPACS